MGLDVPIDRQNETDSIITNEVINVSYLEIDRSLKIDGSLLKEDTSYFIIEQSDIFVFENQSTFDSNGMYCIDTGKIEVVDIILLEQGVLIKDKDKFYSNQDIKKLPLKVLGKCKLIIKEMED